MDNRRALAVATLLAGLAVVGQGQLVAQTIQRALYVSVLNEAGAPVPDLGPSDFIVREDNVAREVLKVAPATEPMQVALLIDNSQAARDYISHYPSGAPRIRGHSRRFGRRQHQERCRHHRNRRAPHDPHGLHH